MQFKDIKTGYPIYVINRKSVTVSVGKVSNITMPHFDNHFPGAAKMVVDVNVDVDGKVSQYVMDDSAEVGYVGDVVITPNREQVVREAESIKAQCESALKMVEWNKEALSKSEEILNDFSPEHKERSEYSERLNGVEAKVDKLMEMISGIAKERSIK